MILGVNLFVTLFFLFLVSITYHNLSLLKDFTQMYLGSFRFGWIHIIPESYANK